MGGGICGAALLRAADALMRALGGETVILVLPATATPSDVGGQLGLVDPGVQQIVITQAAARELETGNLGPRRRVEFTVAASAIAEQLPGLGIGTAEQLFQSVMGISYGGDLFHVESVAPESFAGTVCFYVVTAVE